MTKDELIRPTVNYSGSDKEYERVPLNAIKHKVKKGQLCKEHNVHCAACGVCLYTNSDLHTRARVVLCVKCFKKAQKLLGKTVYT